MAIDPANDPKNPKPDEKPATPTRLARPNVPDA